VIWRDIMDNQLLQGERSDAQNSDEYQTPDYLIAEESRKRGVFPRLDVAANQLNKKCENFLDNALRQEWVLLLPDGTLADVWCNPPHNKIKFTGIVDGVEYKDKTVSQTELFVRKACEQWRKHNINIMMIIPANSTCTRYAEDCIDGKAEDYPIYGSITFIVNDKLANDSSRNRYRIIVWRAK